MNIFGLFLIILIFLILFFVAKKSNRKSPSLFGLKPVPINIQKYMGQWIEAKRLDNEFERGLIQAAANYKLRPDGNIDVINSGVTKDGEAKVAKGVAYPTEVPGSLLVSFFPPITAPYVVIYVDDTYTRAVVASPDRKYLWFLTRDKDDKITPEMILATLDNGYTQQQIDSMV